MFKYTGDSISDVLDFDRYVEFANFEFRLHLNQVYKLKLFDILADASDFCWLSRKVSFDNGRTSMDLRNF